MVKNQRLHEYFLPLNGLKSSVSKSSPGPLSPALGRIASAWNLFGGVTPTLYVDPADWTMSESSTGENRPDLEADEAC